MNARAIHVAGVCSKCLNHDRSVCKCESCGKVFCMDHLQEQDHNCEFLWKSNGSGRNLIHDDMDCDYPRCKGIPISNCRNCKKKFCSVHIRYEDHDHCEAGFRRRKRNKRKKSKFDGWRKIRKSEVKVSENSTFCSRWIPFVSPTYTLHYKGERFYKRERKFVKGNMWDIYCCEHNKSQCLNCGRNEFDKYGRCKFCKAKRCPIIIREELCPITGLLWDSYKNKQNYFLIKGKRHNHLKKEIERIGKKRKREIGTLNNDYERRVAKKRKLDL